MRVKSLFPALRIAVVLTVVLLMSFDIALACKQFVLKPTCHSTVTCIPPSSCVSNNGCRKPVAVFHNLGREWDYSDHKMVMVPDTIEPTLSADLPAIEDSADVTVDDSAVAEDVEQDDDGGATADPDIDKEQASLPEDPAAGGDSADTPVAEPAAEADDATVDEELESLFEDEVEVEDGAADGAKLFHQTFPLIAMEKLPMRGWVDDTGGYFTMGYLVEVHVDFIRLLKKNGRHCTVSWNRLSKLDQEYVSRVAVMVTGMQVALLAER